MLRFSTWSIGIRASGVFRRLALCHEVGARVSDAKEESHRRYQEFRDNAIKSGVVKDVLLFDVEKVFSTVEVARFFGRTRQWVYWGLTPEEQTGLAPFSYRDGTPIVPERAEMGMLQKRVFALPDIREIALACHRRGIINEVELEEVMARILVAEFGEAAFSMSSKKRAK